MKKIKSQTNASTVFNLRGCLYITLFLMGLWGCLSIYNATVFSKEPLFFTAKQLLWLLIGMGLLYVVSHLPFQWLTRHIYMIGFLFFLPLALVVIFGAKVNGMKGWFSFGWFFIQPSELAKAPYVLFLCCLTLKLKQAKNKMGPLILLAGAGLWILPIAAQPDYGTVMIYSLGFCLVYWLAGGKIRYLLLLAGGVGIGAIILLQSKGYVLNRFKGFLDPEAYANSYGWHILQFEYTLARGGVWGVDWGKAVWANSYLPFSYSDSAFASMTESIGFIGAFPVIAGLVILVYAAYRLAHNVQFEVAKCFIMAMASLIVIQALIHISVNLALIPPTGITLPMISYGGSSLISTFLAFGMILSAADPKRIETTTGEKND